MFDPADDGSDEDDYFDPTDPNRRLGPSSTCAPEFAFTRHGGIFQLHLRRGRHRKREPRTGASGLARSRYVDRVQVQPGSLARPAPADPLPDDVPRGRQRRHDGASARLEPDPGRRRLVHRRREGDEYPDLLRRAVRGYRRPHGIAGLQQRVRERDRLPRRHPVRRRRHPGSRRARRSATFATGCANGVLQFRFWIDVNANEVPGDGGDMLLRTWTKSHVLAAPPATARYAVEVRCSALPVAPPARPRW